MCVQVRVEQLLAQNKTLLSQLEKLMTQLTQIQLFQLQQAQLQQQPTLPTPQATLPGAILPSVVEEAQGEGGEREAPVIESASTEQVITDLDAALALSPTMADNDPFQPLNTTN